MVPVPCARRARRVVLLPLCLSACITPPAVLPGGVLTQDLAGFPPGTERVEVRGADGDFRRGVFVPGVPGAPVVLHLMPAAASITYGPHAHDQRFPLFGDPSVWDFHQLGFGSLVLDYRGIGASTGERSPQHLRDDARLAYAEALRRAGGREDRVVVRGTSIGALAAAGLIADGIRPAALVLFAPILGETVARNLVYQRVLFPLAWLTVPLLRPVTDVALLDALRRVPCPLLVFAPYHDADGFVTRAEMVRIGDATQAAGGRVVLTRRGHLACAAAAKYVQPEERTLLLRQFGAARAGPERAAALRRWLASAAPGMRADAGVEARIDLLAPCLPLTPPELFQAALDCHIPLSTLLPWLGTIPRNHPGALADVPLAAWRALFDLADPVRPLAATWIRDAAPWLAGRSFAGNPEGIAAFVWQLLHQPDLPPALDAMTRDLHRIGDLFLSLALLNAYAAIADDQTDPGHCHRQLLRVALKAAAIPDRVVAGADGHGVLEVWEHGAWRPLRDRRVPARRLPPEAAMAALEDGRRELLWSAQPPPWDASIGPDRRVRTLLATLPDPDEITPRVQARLQSLVRQAPLDLALAPGLALAMAASPHPTSALLMWLDDLPEIHRRRLYDLPAAVAATLFELDPALPLARLDNHESIRHTLGEQGIRLQPERVLDYLRHRVLPACEQDTGLDFWLMARMLRKQVPPPSPAALRARILKITLQAIGVPARLSGNGEQLETWRAGTWQPLPVDE